jgi:hypothetical protein
VDEGKKKKSEMKAKNEIASEQLLVREPSHLKPFFIFFHLEVDDQAKHDQLLNSIPIVENIYRM